MWYYIVGVHAYITQEQKQANAQEVRSYFEAHGLTLESICGILGNMDYESSLNPGNKHSESGAWGLIQWYPHTDLTDWCDERNYEWYNGGIQLYRIICEGKGTDGASGYWIPTTKYPYSWSEFCALTNLKTATYAYASERERSNSDSAQARYDKAVYWYKYLTGQDPSEPDDPDDPYDPDDPPRPKIRKKMPLYMYLV